MAGGDHAGGSIALAEAIDDYGEYIFSDFMQYYGINLVHALSYGSGYSPSQLLVLLKNLPLESRTKAEMQGGAEYLGWGIDRYMFASLIDAVNSNTHAVIASASGKKKPRPPKPHPRPNKKKSGAFHQQLQKAKEARNGKSRN